MQLKLRSVTVRQAASAAALCTACFVALSCQHREDRNFSGNDPQFQIDVIHEEAAQPGRIVQAMQNGKERLGYVCKDDDAAVVMFTMRDLRYGSNLSAELLSAKDESGRSYIAELVSQSDIKLIVIKRGFAVRPKAITVEVGNGNPESHLKSPIQVTKIAEPVPVVNPVSPEVAIKGESRIRVVADNQSGVVKLMSVGQRQQNERDRGTFLALSYTPWNRGDRSAIRALPPLYATSTSWARIRVDRYKTSKVESVLTCRNIKLVKSSGRAYLEVPVKQIIGRIRDQDVSIEATLPPTSSSRPNNRGSQSQTLSLECNVDDALKLNADSTVKINPTLSINISNLVPSLGAMRIPSLKIEVLDRHPYHPKNFDPNFNGRPTMSWLFTGNMHSKEPHVESLRELKLMVTTLSETKVSSEVLVLPVHHESISSRGAGARGSILRTSIDAQKRKQNVGRDIPNFRPDLALNSSRVHA